MLEQGKARAEAAHQASLTRLSPAAKAADARLSAIASNRALKVGEKQRQLAAAFQGHKTLDPLKTFCLLACALIFRSPERYPSITSF
ncbi:unnamed protein product [Anisakis simplex]|uniref:Transposase n=1 Tax=Anisakis simplex TaxID=6269 RepID=A0A0M3JEI5_ANISI|nr:unnamed protein product [Anisakis simplex]